MAVPDITDNALLEDPASDVALFVAPYMPVGGVECKPDLAFLIGRPVILDPGVYHGPVHLQEQRVIVLFPALPAAVKRNRQSRKEYYNDGTGR